MEKVLAVNVTANWRLLRSLDLLLRAADAGRVVLITSGVAHSADFALSGGPTRFRKRRSKPRRTYAAETATTSNVRVMLVNPGPLRTRMRAAAMPGEDPLTLRRRKNSRQSCCRCAADWTQTGKLYDFPTDRILHFGVPGPA